MVFKSLFVCVGDTKKEEERKREIKNQFKF